MIWLLLAGMTIAAGAALIWPLWRTKATVGAPADTHLAIYRAQIAEIDRDSEAGRIPSEDAAFARTEAARRLIAESDHPQEQRSSLARRGAASGVIALCCVASGLLYSRLGSPALPDAPLSARAAPKPSDMSLESAVARIENHLAKEPDDIRGWTVIAPVYLRTGRTSDAVTAYENVLRLGGDSPERRADYGEAQVYAAQGMVTADAKRAFERALAQDTKLAKARFYLGLAAEQDGDREKARTFWSGLAAEQPSDSPLAGLLERRLVELDNNASRADMARDVAALPAEQQQAAIRGMVERLASRLQEKGDDLAGWLRLVRAYRVLDELPKARAAIADARKQFAGDPAARSQLDQLAREIGVDGG